MTVTLQFVVAFISFQFIVSQTYACTDNDRTLTCEGVKSEKVCGLSNCANSMCYADFNSQCAACLNKSVTKVLFNVCPNSSSTTSFPYFCTSEDRNRECPQIDTNSKAGNCGLYNSTIKCIKDPCGEDFVSTCLACKNNNVEQVLSTSCSAVSSSTSNERYDCTDKDRGASCENSTKDTSCGYRDSATCGANCIDEFFSTCNACLKPDIKYTIKGLCPINDCKAQDRGSMCTADYSPTCGKSQNGYKTFSNQCNACSNSEIITTKPGECSSSDLNQTTPFVSCSANTRSTVCTMEYKGICALTLEGCTGSKCMFNSGTVCQACSNSSVVGYYDKECQTLFKGFTQDVTRENTENGSTDGSITPTITKSVCQDSDRTGACKKYYRGVCGYKNDQTCKENCTVDSANFCTACFDKDVVYVVEGTCPKPLNVVLDKIYKQDSIASSSQSQNSASYDSYQGILCSNSEKTANCGGNSNGLVCAYKSCSSGLCPENQIKCLACVDAKTQFYVNIDCSSIDPKKLIAPCSSDQRSLNCQMVDSRNSTSVCGIYNSTSKFCLENNCRSNFNSPCEACSVSDITDYIVGVCSTSFLSIAFMLIASLLFYI